MFCHECGTKLPEGALFCPSCGTKQLAVPGLPVEPPAQEAAQSAPPEARKKTPKRKAKASGDNAAQEPNPEKPPRGRVTAPAWLTALPGRMSRGLKSAGEWLGPRLLPFLRKIGRGLLTLLQVLLGLLLLLLGKLWSLLKSLWAKFRALPRKRQGIVAGVAAAVLLVCILAGGIDRPDHSGSAPSGNSASYSSSQSTPRNSSGSASKGSSGAQSSGGGSSSSSSGSSGSGTKTTGICPYCDISGKMTCPSCHGSRGKYVTDRSVPNYSGSTSGPRTTQKWEDCKKCYGDGKITCTHCGGSHKFTR